MPCRRRRPWLAAVLVVLLAALSPWSAHTGGAQEAARPGASDPGAHFSRSDLIGVWETRNVEFGHVVEIVWTLYDDGRLAYDFVVDGRPQPGSGGTWDYRDGVVVERWPRPDGSTGTGRGALERLDIDTMRLTIIDNGIDVYRGLARVYRRRGQAPSG